MNICIFETEHFEVVYTLIKLFDNGKNNISLVIEKSIFERFKETFGEKIALYEWKFVEKSKGKINFFRAIYGHIKESKPDILYLNTISNNHLIYYTILSLLPGKRTILTVHDINCLFFTKKGGLKSILVKAGKKLLIRKINEYNVLSPTMAGYLKERIASGKKTYTIPGAVYEDTGEDIQLADALRIVVPGTIEKKRRNYEEVLELARLLNQQRLPVQIVLAGGCVDEYGNSIIEKAKKTDYKYSTIKYYEQKVVDQNEFDSEIAKSHFVYMPCVIETYSCENISETYGLSKSSGNIADIIKHAKPFIAPQLLQLPSNLKSSCFTYSDIFEIIDFLKKNIQEPSLYTLYQKEAKKNSGFYTLHKIRSENPDIFLK